LFTRARYFFYLFFILLISHHGSAQNKKTVKVDESIFLEHLKIARTDSARSNIYIEWADAIDETQPEKAISLLKKAVAIDEANLEKLRPTDRLYQLFKRDLSYCTNVLGGITLSLGNANEAALYFEKSVVASEEIIVAFQKKQDKIELGSSLNFVGEAYTQAGDLNKALLFFERALKLREQIKDTAGICNTMESLTGLYLKKGDPEKALNYSKKSLAIKEKRSDQLAVALSLSNIGEMYRRMGNVPLCLEHLTKSRNILEKALTTKDSLKAMRSLASCVINIGHLYRTLFDYKKALELFFEVQQMYLRLKDKKGLAGTYNSFGLVYKAQNDTANAIKYYEMGLKLCKEINYRALYVTLLGNLAGIYRNQKKYAEALELYEEHYKLAAELDDVEDLIASGNGFAGVYIAMANDASSEADKRKLLGRALPYALQAMKVSKKLGYTQHIVSSGFKLFPIYKGLGRSKEALETYELTIKMRDSLTGETNRKASLRAQLKYEYEKQATADSVAHAKENEIKSAELSRQAAEIKAKKNQQYALFGGLGLVILFSIFMFRRYRITQKQKMIIEEQKATVEHQKTLVEEKQKEIVDSIHYAKRIQLALLPGEKWVFNTLKRLQK
jgi:tetratricopeptide (TPR) repeat protein